MPHLFFAFQLSLLCLFISSKLHPPPSNKMTMNSNVNSITNGPAPAINGVTTATANDQKQQQQQQQQAQTNRSSSDMVFYNSNCIEQTLSFLGQITSNVNSNDNNNHATGTATTNSPNNAQQINAFHHHSGPSSSSSSSSRTCTTSRCTTRTNGNLYQNAVQNGNNINVTVNSMKAPSNAEDAGGSLAVSAPGSGPSTSTISTSTMMNTNDQAPSMHLIHNNSVSAAPSTTASEMSPTSAALSTAAAVAAISTCFTNNISDGSNTSTNTNAPGAPHHGGAQGTNQILHQNNNNFINVVNVPMNGMDTTHTTTNNKISSSNNTSTALNNPSTIMLPMQFTSSQLSNNNNNHNIAKNGNNNHNQSNGTCSSNKQIHSSYQQQLQQLQLNSANTSSSNTPCATPVPMSTLQSSIISPQQQQQQTNNSNVVGAPSSTNSTSIVQNESKPMGLAPSPGQLLPQHTNTANMLPHNQLIHNNYNNNSNNNLGGNSNSSINMTNNNCSRRLLNQNLHHPGAMLTTSSNMYQPQQHHHQQLQLQQVHPSHIGSTTSKKSSRRNSSSSTQSSAASTTYKPNAVAMQMSASSNVFGNMPLRRGKWTPVSVVYSDLTFYCFKETDNFVSLFVCLSYPSSHLSHTFTLAIILVPNALTIDGTGGRTICQRSN